ncbi:metallophosphoesterase family protein [Ramlibacter tataouinensis]|uniref:metallophosphoesterase family protein n=1 Tax=Ramlibacter tataouinensis TaxID=94132 RepID=UPI0022F38F94|nr:metallophosphoesterase family protein [Ramlibacter tataouinensis]WBY00740.1 metallophosphoesterase family protein [Ramlibacter tataouinensis]
MTRIGLISDTHGLLRPQVLEFLRGSDRILHAGDVCDEAVLRELKRIAPVNAVRGNNDSGAWADRLAEGERVAVEQVAIFMVHDLADLPRHPGARGARVVVSGHSHKPQVQEREGVLFVNPGSAGPRRFKLPIAAGELVVDGDSVAARIVEFSP